MLADEQKGFLLNSVSIGTEQCFAV